MRVYSLWRERKERKSDSTSNLVPEPELLFSCLISVGVKVALSLTHRYPLPFFHSTAIMIPHGYSLFFWNWSFAPEPESKSILNERFMILSRSRKSKFIHSILFLSVERLCSFASTILSHNSIAGPFRSSQLSSFPFILSHCFAQSPEPDLTVNKDSTETKLTILVTVNK